jgi:hypothetical protein
MSMALVGAGLVIDRHLDPNEIVAYIDHATSGEQRARLELHLARCADCRAEVRDAGRIIASLPVNRPWRRRGAFGAAAVAAALLIVAVLPRSGSDRSSLQHREAAVAATISPVILAPVRLVDSLGTFVWRSVPNASRYEVRVFDANGSVVWHEETTDTLLHAPIAAGIQPGRPYYWRVQANVGYDRHVASELTEFTIRRPARP